MTEYATKKSEPFANLSGWLSPDEERLIEMFRDCATDDRSELLYRFTRLRFAPCFAVNFDKSRDQQDPTYLHSELEDELLLICPRHLLGEYFSDSPHLETLFDSAWGPIAPVILGTSEKDGHRADQLFNAAISIWDWVGDGPHRRSPLKFSRVNALLLIDTWRNSVLERVFTNRP